MALGLGVYVTENIQNATGLFFDINLFRNELQSGCNKLKIPTTPIRKSELVGLKLMSARHDPTSGSMTIRTASRLNAHISLKMLS